LNINTSPRNRNAASFDGADGSTNCGRNARKKSATFGFRTFVRKPALKICHDGSARNSAGGAAICGTLNSILTPR